MERREHASALRRVLQCSVSLQVTMQMPMPMAKQSSFHTGGKLSQHAHADGAGTHPIAALHGREVRVLPLKAISGRIARTNASDARFRSINPL